MNYERRWVIQFVHDFPLFIIFYFSHRVWIGVEGRRERVIEFGNFTQLKTKELSEISKPYIYIYIYTHKKSVKNRKKAAKDCTRNQHGLVQVAEFQISPISMKFLHEHLFD